MKNIVQTISKQSLAAKLTALVLIVSLVIPAWVVFNSGSTFAAPISGGPNDTAQNNYINTNTKTSGNADFVIPSGEGTVAGSWIDYLNTQWMNTCMPNFQWTDTLGMSSMSPLWTGATANVANNGAAGPQANAMMIPYLNGTTREIWSGEQLLWAVNNVTSGQTIKLMRNLDLNGNNYAWSRTARTLTNVTINGNGFTIYNLGGMMSSAGGDSGFFVGWVSKCTIQNLTFVNAKLVGQGNGEYSLFGYIQGATSFSNVHVKSSLLYSGATSTYYGCSFLFSSTYASTSHYAISNCSVESSYVYGNSHISALASFTSSCDFTNCYSIDSVVVSWGFHSGGFISCFDGYSTATNCFTNNTVYGAIDTGVFCGDVGDGTFAYCYAAGSVEGTTRLGGFAAYTRTGYGTGYGASGTNTTAFYNCYSTSMVGMQNGGKILGGFIGEITPLSISGGGVGYGYALFENCYAAGEVGSVDTDVTPGRTTYKDVGGFYGAVTDNTSSINVIFTSNYYDKQTTAMREWASGMSQTVAGITGVLTTDTNKSGFGLTHATAPNAGAAGFQGFASGNGSAGNADWVFASGLYPQLAVFANATASAWSSQAVADVVKAYSQASVSTVFCDTYEYRYDGVTPMPATTYDTVRDLTQDVPMTAYSGTMWQKIAFAGLPANATVSLYGQTVPVLTLIQSGLQYTAFEHAPGIQWVNVQVTVNGQKGQRNLRLIPTANLDAGADQTVAAGSTYNHAEDMRLAYSTASRMAVDMNDITQGVFPDYPMDAAQIAIQSDLSAAPASYLTAFKAADNQYVGVNMNHMELNKTHTAPIPSNASTGKMYVIGSNTSGNIGLDNTNSAIDNKFNGIAPFINADAGTYTLVYDWVLQDGRFLQDSKVITIKTAFVSVTETYVEYNNETRILQPPVTNGSVGVGSSYALHQTDSIVWSGNGKTYTYVGYRINGVDYIDPVNPPKPASPMTVMTNTAITYLYTAGSDTYILHIRQVLLPIEGQTALPQNLSLPQMGYMTLTGFNKTDPATILGAGLNITTVSEKDVTPQHFSDYNLSAKTGNQYDVTGIVPQYFHYVGSVVTYTNTTHLASSMNTGQTILVNYAAGQTEAWVTVYFRPNTDNPKDNNVDHATNQFGTINAKTSPVPKP